MEKEIKITPPEGYEIDKENSTLECIKFKPIKPKRFIDDENHIIDGFFINNISIILRDCGHNVKINHNIFATEKLAKSALAMARLSQIRKYDKRFTKIDFDFISNDNSFYYYSIFIKQIKEDKLKLWVAGCVKEYMTERDKLIYFNTAKEANLFLEENEKLLLDYFGIND